MTKSAELAQRLAVTQEHLEGLRNRLDQLVDEIEECRHGGDAEDWLRLTFERDRLAESVIPNIEAMIAARRAEWREARVAELKEQVAPLNRRSSTFAKQIREVEAELATLSDPSTNFRVARLHLDAEEHERHRELLSERERLQSERREVADEAGLLEIELYQLDPESVPIDPPAKPLETYTTMHAPDPHPRQPDRGTVSMRWM